MLKIKPRHVDYAIGFIAALAAFCFLQAVWEYRDSHCAPQQQSAHATSEQKQELTTAAKEKSDGGDEKPRKEPQRVSISCDFIGMVPAAVSFMDHHEGFFVGLFTFFLFVSTAFLWRSTADLYEAGERQLGLAQKQFLATYRPRIVVRFVQGPMRTVPQHGLAAAITFANIGTTEATIVAIGRDLGLRRDGIWIGGIAAEPQPIPPLTLRSGDRHTVEVLAREDEDLNMEIGFNWDLWNQPAVVRDVPRPELCLVGEVRYRDGNGVIRHTGFWRVFDFERKNWIPDKESGGDYED